MSEGTSWLVRGCVVLVVVMNLPSLGVLIPWAIPKSEWAERHVALFGLVSQLPVMVSWLLAVPLVCLSKAARRNWFMWGALVCGFLSMAVYSRVFNWSGK